MLSYLVADRLFGDLCGVRSLVDIVHLACLDLACMVYLDPHHPIGSTNAGADGIHLGCNRVTNYWIDL